MAFLWMEKKYKLLLIELHPFQFGMYNVSWVLQTFIEFSSRIISKAPLICLIGKDKYIWDVKAVEAFKTLKKTFTSAPILVYADSSKPFFLEVDASDFVLDSLLFQYGEDGRLHPIAYCSSKFSTAEINYEIHDKKLLAIIDAFEEWCHLFEGAQHTTTVYTDHKNLEYFMSAPF